MAVSAHSRAVSQLLLAALCWSLGGLLIKSVDWPPLARFFFLDLATLPLRYLAPRPVSTTRRVSATICASMARV